MSATELALYLTIVFASLLAVCFLIGAIRDVALRRADAAIAESTGVDPRRDDAARAEAAAQVASRRRHPSSGDA